MRNLKENVESMCVCQIVYITEKNFIASVIACFRK